MATRQQIITGAARMFERCGFEGASLGDIVAGAGTTKGALYFHFQSKDDLASVVIAEQHRISLDTVAAIADTGTDALRQLVMLTHETARQLIEDPIVRAGIRLVLEFGSVGGRDQPYRDWIEAARAIVEAGIARGQIAATIDAGTFARFLAEAFTGAQLVSQVLTCRQDLEHRVDAMWQLLLPSVAATDDVDELAGIRAARWSRPESIPNTPVTEQACA
nr:ScbR family autoregulator-binding transcription factor [Prescottella sp. R16]